MVPPHTRDPRQRLECRHAFRAVVERTVQVQALSSQGLGTDKIALVLGEQPGGMKRVCPEDYRQCGRARKCETEPPAPLAQMAASQPEAGQGYGQSDSNLTLRAVRCPR